MLTRLKLWWGATAATRALIWHGLSQMFAAFDQFLNVFLFPFSWNTWADETFSSRCGRLQHRRPYVWFAFVANVLFYFQERDMNHCKRAYEKEKQRYPVPPDMRGK
jgi:hypothetical protein